VNHEFVHTRYLDRIDLTHFIFNEL
jgi:hypothetical protein